ncbi:hypothetical protein [Microbispora sp. NPDC049633]|uniref:hypothetical protein n=1 Tax=Microbispora sp. NPDC049633 TaxID=3154355 RepID=UPI0034128E51
MTHTLPTAPIIPAEVAEFVSATLEHGGATITPATGRILPVGTGGAETAWIVGVRTDRNGARIPSEFVYLADLSPEYVAGFVGRVWANTDGAADATAGSWVLEDPTPEARAEAARRRAEITGIPHTDNPDTDGPIVALDHGSFLPYLDALSVAWIHGEESIFGPATFATVYTGRNNACQVINALDAANTRLAVDFLGQVTVAHLTMSPRSMTSGAARFIAASRTARAVLSWDADARTLATSPEWLIQAIARADSN